MSTKIEDAVQRYLATFNETDPARRRAALRELYTDDCAYTDPHADLRGVEQIDGFLAAVQARYPGVVFTLGGPVDAHHEQARFTWHADPPGAAPLAIGFDVIALEGGRIRRVYGFIDKAPG